MSDTTATPAVASSGACSAAAGALLPTREAARLLIGDLCRQFYTLGWVTGTGGGIALRAADGICLAPSGVQKERIEPQHIFAFDPAGSVILESPPAHLNLRPSQCHPLFMLAFSRRGAGACIHTHSQHAVMVTLQNTDVFSITHQEMIKGVRNDATGKYLSYFDTLTIPIIHNTAHERDLEANMAVALERYPEACAVLVRRHGVYVWGPTWEKAKTICECLDYLFEISIKMRQIGLDPAEIPADCPGEDHKCPPATES